MQEAVNPRTDELIDSAVQNNQPVYDEKRDQPRLPYNAKVTLRLLSPGGDLGPPVTVQAVDISEGGIRVESRNMFVPRAEGGVLLARSDGTTTLMGVRVRHCRYISRMRHHTGMQFIPIPPAVAARMDE